MKTVGIVVLILCGLSVSYYFIIALPSHNRALLKLEQDRRAKEEDKKPNQSAEQQMEKERKQSLEACLNLAVESRETTLRLNDTGKSKNGGYLVPIRMLEQIEKAYQDECEECYRKYGKQ